MSITFRSVSKLANQPGKKRNPEITAVAGNFVKTIRTGIDPTSHQLINAMPWQQFSAAYTDAELGDIYQYLHGLKPIQK